MIINFKIQVKNIKSWKENPAAELETDLEDSNIKTFHKCT